jgi:RNA polymerase sigma-70 factor, ECF subfamily
MELDKIWREYHRELLSFIRYRVGADDLAEDILQDVFVKVHTQLDTLANADRLQSWLYQIARNAIIDDHRTHKSTEPLTDEMAQNLGDNSEYNVHNDHEEWLELGKCLLPMVEKLPPGYREAILLFEIDGLPLKEVAQRLKLSLPGAKSRVQRGREKLRRIFLDCCNFKFDRRGKPIDWSPRNGCDRISC